MLWIALHLPLLSLEAWCTTVPGLAPSQPVALVDDHRVTAANAAAAARGIKPGMKRATALTLAGNLLTAQAEPRRDAAALQAVAHAALAYTPLVAIDGDATVLLEVQSTQRCFGGIANLLLRLSATLVPLGHRVQMAAAPTPLGASLLARWRRDLAQGPHTSSRRALATLLDEVPVWLLGPGREHWEAVQGMGLSTLGDLRSLPRSGIARRFSEDILEDLDHAYGERADPRDALVPPPVHAERLELQSRADTSAQVLHGAAVLLARLVAWAGGQHARIAAFTLVMRHEPRHRRDGGDAEATLLRIELAEPALDLAHLQMLLRERLARVELPAPTLELELECRDIARVGPPNAELFPNRQSQAEGLTRLLERLRARLGDAQVLRIVNVADHRPERASILEPTTRPPPPPFVAAALRRPAWLLPEPVALTVRNGVPLHGGRPLQLLSDAERIETGWWDGGLVSRDYHIAQVDGGALIWVFRQRLEPGGWFLQGRFG